MAQVKGRKGKIRRGTKWFAVYRNSNRWMVNSLKRQIRHLRRNPSDKLCRKRIMLERFTYLPQVIREMKNSGFKFTDLSLMSE